MQSEVRKVLESMRGRGNGWDAYWFWNEIDAAERADAARREEPRNVTFSDVVAVHCVRCGMQISTTEYVVRCNCGTTIMVHRHNQRVTEMGKELQALRQAVAELIAEWEMKITTTGWKSVAPTVRQILDELNSVIATKPESQPATSKPSVTFGVSPKLTLPAGKPADEHIRTIAAQAVRDAIPDVLDGLAETFGEAGFTSVTSAFREHAAKMRKEREA